MLKILLWDAFYVLALYEEQSDIFAVHLTDKYCLIYW